MTNSGVILIGVAGGSGSGKTTLCQRMGRELEQIAAVLSCDHYYHCQAHLDGPERSKVNYDHPQSIDFSLLAAHLRLLAEGHAVDIPSRIATRRIHALLRRIESCPRRS